jgi:hypothetical protein
MTKVDRRPAPRWCLSGISKTQSRRLQKLRQKELAKKREEEERDREFNHTRPMTKVKQTWWEKRLAREENGSNDDSINKGRIEEKVVVTGDVNKGLHGAEAPSMKINMVFTILSEFHALEKDVAELALGAERAVFERPEKTGEHMKPLFIQGHLDGALVGHVLVDGGASVNLLPLSTFKKLGHGEGDLKRTNLSLSEFSGEPTEAMMDTIDEVLESQLRALEEIEREKAGLAKAYNKRVKEKSFQVGDLVWKTILPLGSRNNRFGKLSPSWEGPFKVIKIVHSNAYFVETPEGTPLPKALNCKYLKRFYPSVWQEP